MFCGSVKKRFFGNVLKRVVKRANGLQSSDEECENLRDFVYFSTIVDIFPHVETYFLERVREKFVLDAHNYSFYETIDTRRAHADEATEAETPPRRATPSRS